MKKYVRTILTVLLSICILLSCISVSFAAAPANGNQETSREAFRVGIDSETRGHWQGKYGNDAAILFGYNYSGEIDDKNGTDYYGIDPYNYNLIVKPASSDFSGINCALAGTLWCKNADPNDETILDRPESAQCKQKFFCGAFSGPINPGNRLTHKAEFHMTMTSEEYHLITIYGSTDMRASFYVIFEKDGTEILVDELPADTFIGGKYVSYLVPGSATMYMDKKYMDTGITGIFVDKVSASTATELMAVSGTEPRSVKLTWQEAGLDSAAKVAIDRKSGDADWKTIQTVQSGLKEYIDENLQAGVTYSYRLRVVSGITSSLPCTAVSYSVPVYTKTTLTLDKPLYSVKNSTQAVA